MSLSVRKVMANLPAFRTSHALSILTQLLSPHPSETRHTASGTRSYTTGETQSHSSPDPASSNAVRTSPTPEELEKEEPWMQEEIKDYYRSKNLLAKMMGCDPESFTQADVDEAIRYLLPSSLTAKDARPFLKHPSEIYPKRKELAFDKDGRPLEIGFYTGFPAYHNLIHEIYKQERILQNAERTTNPVESGGSAKSIQQQMKWISKDKLCKQLSEELSDEQYKHVIERFSSLANHSQSHRISEFLDQYRKPVFEYRLQAKLPTINERGYAYAVGRRKTSVAQVWLKESESGDIMINRKSFLEYFQRLADRQQVLFPLLITNLLGHYDVKAKIHGGGITGQAGALRHGISRALLAYPGDHADVLDEAGLLIRDPRMVERKKPGQKKARKKFAWVKR